MGEIECKPPTKVIIEASVVTIPEKSHSLSINNVTEPSPSSILTRLHSGYFRISLSLGGQAMLWKILTESNGVSKDVWHVFHKLSSTAEFMHHIGVNYLYTPWISWLILLQSAQIVFPNTKKRFLSIMANPTSQISVIGNLVAARAAAQMVWKESAVFMWSLGMACRPSLFKKSMRKFNVAWWAYSFPLTFLALAAADYAQEVKARVATVPMLVLSVLSVLVFLGLMLLTVANTDRMLGETDPIESFSNNLKSST
ncbi:hypothetical protein CRYUN_Cryun31cG0011500 [Craigia yunnanensis]